MPTEAESLSEALDASEAILFDFDGPICDVFSGLPAPAIAEELAGLLAALAPALAGSAQNTDDPMEVHSISREGGSTVLAAVEAALTAAEVRAVKVAGSPTAGAVLSLQAARNAGRHVAIVSNNSAQCVREYLSLHGILELVDEIIGRPTLRPDLMKPSPHPLLTAASLFGVEPGRTVLVGDSVTDIEAAHAAGSRSVGYANKEPKRTSLVDAGADAVVFGMKEIADCLALSTDASY
ncbi:HAD-IA family hydrolase [Streptomyces virginiae]|uniref:HAD family hydrolase n=1 Tax=Streptomyces virginiae TaxID=1961 RepID=UPI00224E843C|nr:HAD-IA family hydrolase [Streptomyces virginiae]MCX4719886.1 HAD-IA family hydrolase [Streptomyces virginiae]